MRTLLFFFAVLSLSAGQDPNSGRMAAIAAAHRGDWRAAEEHERRALAACRDCSPEVQAVLRAELAGYLTLGGFPEAAAALWRQSLQSLPANSPHRAAAYLGLGVALHSAGHTTDAAKAWRMACAAAENDTVANAACRFNVAVARMDAEPVWSELESVLPVLMTIDGPLSRATVLLQTARAAIGANQSKRARLLLAQADVVITQELHPQHPFLAIVYQTESQLAAIAGDQKQAKLWRKKAAKLPAGKGWDRATVSLDELKGKQ